MERERLARLFERGLDEVVGHVLPIRRVPAIGDRRHPAGKPARGSCARERCYLVPGDSPLGLRLPLQSLPWVSKEDYPYTHEPIPWNRRARCRRVCASCAAGARARARSAKLPRSSSRSCAEAPLPGKSAAHVISARPCAWRRATALLYVFMPPTDTLEDYLELVAAVEATAEALAQPVVIEGYEPPRDPRLNSLPHHAGSGCHRGQHPSVVELGRTGRSHHSPV